MLQSLELVKLPTHAPPACALDTIVRLCTCVPSPQEVEQSPNAFQLDQMQSVGQSHSVSHFASSTCSPQSLLLVETAAVPNRRRLRRPCTPQVSEQELQGIQSCQVHGCELSLSAAASLTSRLKNGTRRSAASAVELKLKPPWQQDVMITKNKT